MFVNKKINMTPLHALQIIRKIVNSVSSSNPSDKKWFDVFEKIEKILIESNINEN